MAVLIKRVRGNSSFFRPGDEIISIASHPLADQLDLFFRTGAGGKARFTIRRGARELSRTLTMRAFEKARLVFDEMRFTRCMSNCIFCFMDQMPRGLRPSLYEKDDDYRLSFLFGNFITLNDVRECDIERIIEHRLEPLYLSVHAVEERVRERIFGRPMRRNIMEDMKRLARAGISMHAQIVLVPGVNDGAVLRKTVGELFTLYPACRSVAVVPVGLTAHREGLPYIRKAPVAGFRSLIRWAERERKGFRAITLGESFLHLADEFYLATNRSLPGEETYDDFPQLANGVGMCRHFLKALERDLERREKRGLGKLNMTIATGTLGARFLRRYALPMLEKRLSTRSIRIMTVRNRLFGPLVNVTGLLSGSDIVRAAKRSTALSGCLVIPGNAVNHDGLFIDDLRPADVEREIGVPVLVAESTFLEDRIVRKCVGGSTL